MSAILEVIRATVLSGVGGQMRETKMELLAERRFVLSHVRAFIVCNLIFWLADRIVGEPEFGWAPTVGGIWAMLLGLHLWGYMLSKDRL